MRDVHSKWFFLFQTLQEKGINYDMKCGNSIKFFLCHIYIISRKAHKYSECVWWYFIAWFE
jgi:hypothetical protein